MKMYAVILWIFLTIEFGDTDSIVYFWMEE